MSLQGSAFALKVATVKRDAGGLFDELRRNQFLPPEGLGALTTQRSSEIAQFAFRSTAFYRAKYSEAGFSEADLRDPEAFSALPIIDRTMVKADAAQFRSSEATERNSRGALTGGSTGQPLATLNDARVPVMALSWRMYSWWGVEPYDHVVHIGRWAGSRKDRLKLQLSWWPTNVLTVDAGKLGRAEMDAFISHVNRHRPPLIEGYVGAMREIANYVMNEGLAFHRPRAIGVTAAPLTGEVRSQIEKGFGAPVYDQYRSSEIQWMAGECARQDGLHVFSDMRRIEVVDSEGRPAPRGTVGDLVVTDLANRAFPMIRYRLGDRGSLRAEACPCGVNLPLMDPPDGRTVDMIRLPDGTVVAGGLFTIFSGVPDAVTLFQMHQSADYSITLRVVLGPATDARESVDAVAEGLSRRFENQVPVRVEVVDSLPYTRGKLKYVTSDVPG